MLRACTEARWTGLRRTGLLQPGGQRLVLCPGGCFTELCLKRHRHVLGEEWGLVSGWCFGTQSNFQRFSPHSVGAPKAFKNPGFTEAMCMICWSVMVPCPSWQLFNDATPFDPEWLEANMCQLVKLIRDGVH